MATLTVGLHWGQKAFTNVSYGSMLSDLLRPLAGSFVTIPAGALGAAGSQHMSRRNKMQSETSGMQQSLRWSFHVGNSSSILLAVGIWWNGAPRTERHFTKLVRQFSTFGLGQSNRGSEANSALKRKRTDASNRQTEIGTSSKNEVRSGPRQLELRKEAPQPLGHVSKFL